MNTTTRTLTAAAVGCIVAAAVAAAATGMTTTAAEVPDQVAHSSEHARQPHTSGASEFQHALAPVRRATERFRDLDTAKAAGYELGWVNGSGDRIITNCVANPTAGAMGYHYFNATLMADDSVDLLAPEVLVYARGDDAELELVAVEWVARGPASNPPGPAKAPRVLGMPMHILVPAVGFHVMHAWLWKSNPAGMFADWNPDVTCP